MLPKYVTMLCSTAGACLLCVISVIWPDTGYMDIVMSLIMLVGYICFDEGLSNY